ncbi:MAG: MaoC family dehydratase N-terminal domain-containing protein [Deltaproteobacteria bacterium]|nr:MaoC family dehydratase N-terminal domain-containing protein [Deltaproteobacteria bacterium]
MADQSKKGKSLPPYEFRVERVKIQEFVQAIGDHNPLFRDRKFAIAEGYPDTPCPPTFFTLENVLHGEEEYEYLAEVYPGEILTCHLCIESIVEKQSKSGKMDFITLKTSFLNQAGEEVLRARSLIIERII